MDDGVIVQCDCCQARYHKECATSCVILGCAGQLLEISPEAPAKVIVQEREAVVESVAAPGVKKKESQDPTSLFTYFIFMGLFLFAVMALGGDGGGVFSLLGGCCAPVFFVYALMKWYLPTPKKDPGKKPSSKSPDFKEPESRGSTKDS